jgi:KamA family protein
MLYNLSVKRYRFFRPEGFIIVHVKPHYMKLYGLHNVNQLPQFSRLHEDEQFALKVVARVLPFRVNNYVTEELIDWNNHLDDPMYHLTFPQREMLSSRHFESLAHLIRREASQSQIEDVVNKIHLQLNPHSDGQRENIPALDGEKVPGLQHKYRETCLIFPSNGQVCQSYCTYCFRWPQFVSSLQAIKFATEESQRFVHYLRQHKEITDVLITGGDPMIMSAEQLRRYLEPLLQPEFDHIQAIRIGSKSLAYWPYRYVADRDADDILRLFEQVVQSGKHLAFMAHFTHWKELSTSIVQQAIARIRQTGAEIRTQAPIVRHVNNNAETWIRLWKEEVRLGCIPYYMFIARETGASHYFALPLVEATRIFAEAYQQVSGLCRTVRGPSMSTYLGKVVIEGVAEIYGQQVFVLNFLQGRNPSWCKQPFFAQFDTQATWLDELRPAFGEKTFFYEQQHF